MEQTTSAAVASNVLMTGRMTYAPDYFYKAAASYGDWRSAWWREALQNAVDAGATEVLMSQAPGPDGGTTLVTSVSDNGSGMSQETLVERFLAFGGSEKSADAVGGFGKAKELLILPWISWSMRSRDLHAHGVAMDWTLERCAEDMVRFVESDRVLMTTKLEVHMGGPSDKQTFLWAAKAVLRKSDLPRTRVTIDDGVSRLVESTGVKTGTFAREFTFGKLYLCDAKGLENYLLVRVKGLFMHQQYLWTPLPEGKTLVLEVSTPSTETFTDNRDALLPELKRELDKFVQEYSSDRHSALMDKSKLERHVFRGAGKFRARRLEEGVEGVAAKHDAMLTRNEQQEGVSPAQTENLIQMLEQMVREITEEDTAQPDTARPVTAIARRFSEATARAALETVDVKAGSLDLEKLLKQLVWEPDFMCSSKVPGYQIPAEMMPETMSPRVTKVAMVWTELCRYVMALLKCNREFGVGFLFDETETAFGAAYSRLDDGSEWLMINPYKSWRQKNLIASTSDDDLAQMFACAVHECTHLASGISKHDENFAAALTGNFARCAKGWRKIKQIERGAKMTNKVKLSTVKNG